MYVKEKNYVVTDFLSRIENSPKNDEKISMKRIRKCLTQYTPQKKNNLSRYMVLV